MNRNKGIMLKADMNNRNTTRINCTIPTEFTVDCTGHNYIKFSAYILNMSKNGMYVEYLDSKKHIDMKSWDPVNLDVNKIIFYLPNTEHKVSMKGRIVHKCINSNQIGIGIKFNNMDMDIERKLESFIEEG